MMAVYKDAEDLISVGAYKNGNNPKIDKAIKLIEPINQFLIQGINEGELFNNTLEKMKAILRTD
jgi:flagellum-specific ATP synthase